MQALVKRVQEKVTDFGGYCTWPFSQMTEPMVTLRAAHRETRGGLCSMMAACWIERHANGSSLASWLSSASGDIDHSKVRQLIQLSIISGTMRSGMMMEQNVGSIMQEDATLSWLRQKGVVVCRVMTIDEAGNVSHSTEDIRTGARHGWPKVGFVREMVANVQKDLYTCCNNYALMGLIGHINAHGMAAWVGNDVCYFDPNFGEFYFHDRYSFLRWFPHYFGQACYPTQANDLCEFYKMFIMSPSKPKG